jgi:hypothetical protein
MERIMRWKVFLPPKPILISILVFIVLVVVGVIGYLVWPTSLEPWEEAAIDFLSVESVQGKPDQPGPIWVTSTPGETPTEKTVYILLDEAPSNKANLRITYMKEENGKWLVDITNPKQVDKEQFKAVTEANGWEWKEWELK